MNVFLNELLLLPRLVINGVELPLYQKNGVGLIFIFRSNEGLSCHDLILLAFCYQAAMRSECTALPQRIRNNSAG
jgi:hypothetical protein